MLLNMNIADILKKYTGGWQPNETVALRKEKPLWTNCTSIDLISFMEKWKTIRLIVKKSRLDYIYYEQLVTEYNQIKDALGRLVPRQVFIPEKVEEHWKRIISAFCTPVTIAYDIFEEKNFEIFTQEVRNNKLLRHQLKLFITWYEYLKESWFFLDLYWKENLIITKDWELKYVDSFFVNLAWKEMLIQESEENFKKLLLIK